MNPETSLEAAKKRVRALEAALAVWWGTGFPVRQSVLQEETQWFTHVNAVQTLDI